MTNKNYKVRYEYMQDLRIYIHLVKNTNKQHLIKLWRTFTVVSDRGFYFDRIYLYVDKCFLGGINNCVVMTDEKVELSHQEAMMSDVPIDVIIDIIAYIISQEVLYPESLFIQYLRDHLLELMEIKEGGSEE